MEAIYCPRCESVGRKSHKNATNIVLGPNGFRTQVCDECLNDIDAEIYTPDEVEENEDAS